MIEEKMQSTPSEEEEKGTDVGPDGKPYKYFVINPDNTTEKFTNAEDKNDYLRSMRENNQ